MRKPSRAAAGEHDTERAADQPAGEPARSRVARLRRRKPVERAGIDPVDQRAEGLARGWPEDQQVGVGERDIGEGAVTRGHSQHAIGLPRAEVAPRADAGLVHEEHVSVLLLGTLDGACACRRRVEHLDRAVGLERAGERRGNRAERDVRADSHERDQRGPRRRRLQPAARLQLQRELASDRGREVWIVLE